MFLDAPIGEPFYVFRCAVLSGRPVGCGNHRHRLSLRLASQRMTGSFGLRSPAPDADTRAWLRPKGIRDIVSGLVVLALMLTTDPRTVGIALIVFVIVPLGDMSNVLASGGSKSTALSVHGLTCAVEVVVGLFLIRVL